MERDAIKQTPQRRGDKGSVQRSLRSAGRCGPTRLPWRPLQGSTRQTPAHKMVHCVQHCTTGNRCNGVHDAYALYSCYSASNGARLCDRVLARVELLLCEILLLLLRHLQPTAAQSTAAATGRAHGALGVLRCRVAHLAWAAHAYRCFGFRTVPHRRMAWLGLAWLGCFTLRCGVNSHYVQGWSTSIGRWLGGVMTVARLFGSTRVVPSRRSRRPCSQGGAGRTDRPRAGRTRPGQDGEVCPLTSVSVPLRPTDQQCGADHVRKAPSAC